MRMRYADEDLWCFSYSYRLIRQYHNLLLTQFVLCIGRDKKITFKLTDSNVCIDLKDMRFLFNHFSAVFLTVLYISMYTFLQR